MYAEEKLYLEGSLLAMGGNSSMQGFSLIAGGAGGSIVLTARRIVIKKDDKELAQINVNGGLPDSQVFLILTLSSALEEEAS